MHEYFIYKLNCLRRSFRDWKSPASWFDCLVEFMVIPSFIGFVPKKVNFFIILEESEAVSFVPSFWHDIEGNLSTNWIRHVQIYKLFLQDRNKLFPYLMLFIINLELISFFLRTIPAYWRDVDHPSPVLNKCSSFYG